jgi:transposase InsO family protein
MPFRGVSVMDQRAAFVSAARVEGANVRDLCRAYKISPTTGYKWLGRVRGGAIDLADRSRRPHRSPRRTAAELEAAVVAVRLEHPRWGGRKIHHFLKLEGVVAPPHPNTATGILRRHGLIDPVEALGHRPFQRFEHDAPNRLWQMDFKGHFPVADRRCHPLTVVDDHSRYAVVLVAFADERRHGVQAALEAAFRDYGLPERMLMDNGPPWGTDSEHRHTRLTAWLMRLDIGPVHGRPYHPQTQGKNERFNRTLKEELIADRCYPEIAAVQADFDWWRHFYNHRRPHQAIGHVPPAHRFRASERPFPEHLPPIEYPAGLPIRRVQVDGRIYFAGRSWFVSQAFDGQDVALQPAGRDGLFNVLFCTYHVGEIDLAKRT